MTLPQWERLDGHERRQVFGSAPTFPKQSHLCVTFWRIGFDVEWTVNQIWFAVVGNWTSDFYLAIECSKRKSVVSEWLSQ
jgi:hypothetical protein